MDKLKLTGLTIVEVLVCILGLGIHIFRFLSTVIGGTIIINYITKLSFEKCFFIYILFEIVVLLSATGIKKVLDN